MVTIEQIQEKRAELIAKDGFFELDDIELDGHTYKKFKHAPATCMEILQNARGHGEAEFMVYQEARYTYNSFFAAVDAMAAALQDHGIVPGDRVAIAMRNCPDWAISFAAATLIGAVVVPVNSWGKTEELSYVIKDCGAKLLVCDAARLALLEGVLSDISIDVNCQ